MGIYGDNFWPSILLGNIAFLLMISSIRLFFRVNKFKSLCVVAAVALFVTFIGIGTFERMSMLPELIYGLNGNWSGVARMAVGYMCVAIFLLDMAIYTFITFKLQLYAKRKPQYRMQVYNIYLFLIVLFIWNVSAVECMLFLGAQNGNYKESWNIWFTILLAIIYCGKIVLSILDSQKFEIKNNRYKYCNFKQRLEGDLTDIKLVELVNGGLVLHINEETLFIKGISRYYVEEFAEKFSEYIKCENKIVYEEQTDKG